MAIESMLDPAPQLLEALRAIDGVTVTERWPMKQPEGDTLVLTEITNANTSIPVVDSLGYQVDVWSDDQDRAREIMLKADAILTGIGFLRSSAGPFSFGNGFRKTNRYSRRVDKRFMRLID